MVIKICCGLVLSPFYCKKFLGNLFMLLYFKYLSPKDTSTLSQNKPVVFHKECISYKLYLSKIIFFK